MAHRDGPGAPWSAQKRIELRGEAALDGVVTMKGTLASVSASTAVPGHLRRWRERRPGFTLLLRVACALGSAAVPDARRVWLNGVRVLAVRREDIRGEGWVAAILRYEPA
jgi:hypothetical protein